MRKLGLIGGMSWVSTRAYYERINRLVQKAKTPTHSAPLLIESLEYAPLYALREEESWDQAARMLIDSARRLEDAGAGAITIFYYNIVCAICYFFSNANSICL